MTDYYVNFQTFFSLTPPLALFHMIVGHESRRGEAVAMEAMMKQLGLQVVKMREPGLMDGGDVLFTGSEFFVGLSTRTNQVRTACISTCMHSYSMMYYT